MSTTAASAADLVIVGASIRTLDPACPHASAIAIADGVVLAVGDDAVVREHAGPRTELIDGLGIAIVPGLTDAHQHPLWASRFAVGVFAAPFGRDLDALGSALRAERERVGPDAIVRAWSGLYETFEPHGGLDGALLERLAGGPALLVMSDLHTYLASTSVLAMAGIDGPRAFPDNSEVVCDEHGRPTGELREFSAFDALVAALPGEDRETRLRRVRGLLAELAALGICGVHAMDGSPESYEDLRELEARGQLTARIISPLWIKPHHDDALVAEYLPLAGARGRRWRGGTAKFFADGVVETGTAWLEQPDALGAGTEPAWLDQARYADLVARCTAAGFACTTHAIGDAAVRSALDAYRAAGPPRDGRSMHRIEHLEMITDELVARVAAEGVAASMQPLHMSARSPDFGDLFARRLGRERAAMGFRTGDLLRAGAVVPLGSDWPVADKDPRLGMAWARLRREPGSLDAEPLEPQQRMTAEQALAGYTTAAARVNGEQAIAGRLAPGMRADLTGLAEDPVACDADALPRLPVRLTIVDGEVVFRGSE